MSKIGLTVEQINAMEPTAIVRNDNVRDKFIQIYEAMWTPSTGTSGEAAYERESRNFNRLLSEKEDVRKTCTKFSLFTAFLDVAISGLTLDPGTKAQAYLLARSVAVDSYYDNGQKKNKYETHCMLTVSGYGELVLRARCMIRREKAKVLTQLPDKTRTDLIVDISNRDEYMLAEADLAEYLRTYTECDDIDIRRKMRMEALVKFMTLRSLSAKGKVKQAIDFTRTFLANGKPLILFCSLHEIVDEIKKAFPKAVSVTGRDSMMMKQAAVDAFQSGKAQLIVCSIKAAGVGLTLTASSNVAFVEFPWTYADCCQCEDRAHRIGQKDNVTCYYLLGRGTIDRTLYAIIHKKKSIANQIMATDDDIPQDEMYFDQLTSLFLNPDDDG